MVEATYIVARFWRLWLVLLTLAVRHTGHTGHTSLLAPQPGAQALSSTKETSR